jgi:hypothetical protein
VERPRERLLPTGYRIEADEHAQFPAVSTLAQVASHASSKPGRRPDRRIGNGLHPV